MGALVWLLQWPIRALILLIVAWLPLGVEVENFGIGLLAAVVIGLLGSLLIFPLRALFALPWLITSFGGLLTPILADPGLPPAQRPDQRRSGGGGLRGDLDTGATSSGPGG